MKVKDILETKDSNMANAYYLNMQMIMISNEVSYLFPELDASLNERI